MRPLVLLSILLAACGSAKSDQAAPAASTTTVASRADTTKKAQSRDTAAPPVAAVPAPPARPTTPATTKPAPAAEPASSGYVPAPAKPLDQNYPVIRALYVNRFAAQSTKKMQHLIALADRTEINGFVIDMKDEFGLNFLPANTEYRKLAGSAGVVRNLPALLDSIKAHHLVPIARMVVFKDSVTARLHPEWTIRKPDSSLWRDGKGMAWVNPYHRELWEYNIGVAEELVKLGFQEIQFDYIRFPEPFKTLPTQVFPGAGSLSKEDALAQYLAEARQRLDALGARTTADIFGLVTTVPGALEVGQQWEKLSPVTDVLLPMVYPSHYPSGSFGINHPNGEPYKIVNTALAKAHSRDLKIGVTSTQHVRPWLQAFTLGAPHYGPEQLAAEKQGAYDAGYEGWVLWNPGSNYDAVEGAILAKSALEKSEAKPKPGKLQRR